MLKNLSISNYALIKQLEMTPSTSLNMITGETGAGKSIMLGAVGLLLGNRADTKSLLEEDKKCVVEGIFDIASYGLTDFFEQEELDYDDSCILRREISPSGKSRAFINDTPVRLETLKSLGKSLMDVHSQNDHLLLSASEYQLDLIDAYAGARAELQSYSEKYKTYSLLKKQFDKLSGEAIELNKEADYNKFQLEELSALQLVEGEQKVLEEQQTLLDNAEEIKTKISEALQQLNEDQYGAVTMLSQVQHNLNYLSKFGVRFIELRDRLQSTLIEITDIGETLDEESGKIEIDFEKQERTRDRLDKIYRLQKKHGVNSIEALMQIGSKLADKVFQTDYLEEELEKLKVKIDMAWKEVLEKAKILTARRQSSFAGFCEKIKGHLHHLGMENARVEVVLKEVNPTVKGKDEVEILFSANKGIRPQPIKQVASGGEFSRLIFAIKYIMADKVALPTLIFDEIDTGISGEIALQMVKMMQEIAKKHQVICISHLPQVAAKGENHYFVYKDHTATQTVSKIKLLSQEERVREIAKMIAGANPSSNAYKSAEELLIN